MATRKLSFDLPAELLADLGPSKTLAGKAKEAFVLELLREARISQGKAAELLGINRWDRLDLMAHYRIPSGPATTDEVDEEVRTARRLAREKLAG